MKNQNQLLPSLETDFVNKKSGEINIRYRPGFPRRYRFDASRGVFGVNGDATISKRGASISFIPISYRVFKDDILGYGLKKWIEFFFVNQAGHLCSLLFHGFSVENLQRKTNDLFYDEVNLSQVILTATPIEKVKQEGEGKGNKYFIAEFSYKVLEKEQQANIKLIGEALNIWQSDTLTGDAIVEIAVNFKPPIQIINEEQSPSKVPAKQSA